MYRAVVGVFVLAACGGGGNKTGDDAQPSTCGDGVANGTEACDGSDLGGVTDCRDLGYYDAAPVTCTASCTLDASQCAGSCGDGVVQPEHELCDGADFAGSCTDYGYGAGAVTCQACVADFAGCAYVGWHRDYLPIRPSDISGSSDADVWVAGDGGVVHWDGSTWQRVYVENTCGGNVGFDVVSVAGPGDVWFAGDHVVARVMNGVCTTHTLATTTNQIQKVLPIAPDDVWVAGLDKTWHFDGQSWTSHDVALVDLWAAGHDDVWGVDGLNHVEHYDGATWTTTTLTSSRDLTSIWGTSPTDIYAAGQWLTTAVVEHYDGTWTENILADHDGVTSIAGGDNRVFAGLATTVKVREPHGWTTLARPPLSSTTRMYASPTGRLYVVPRGTPQVFRYDGTDERELPFGTPWSVAPTSPSEIWAVTSGGLFMYDGDQWQQDTSLTGVTGVTTALTGETIAMATGGLYTRSGSTWSNPSGVQAGLIMWAASPTDVWVQDYNRVLHHWNGFSDRTTDMPQYLTQLWGTSATDLYALTAGYLFEHWDGTSWSDVVTPGLLHPTSIWGWAPNDIVVTDEAEAVWHFDGATWTQMDFPFPVLDPVMIWGTSNHDIFVSNLLADVFHYDGARWSPVRLQNAAQITAITGTGDTVLFFDASAPAHHLVRTHAWH